MTDTVRDNSERHRFELDLADGGVAFVTYRLAPGVITLTHTEVPGRLRGQGIGARLVVATMQALAGRGLRVVPACGFAADVISAHAEFADLLRPPAEGAAQAQSDAKHARLDAKLDEALKETFPASDPIAVDGDR